MTRLFRAVQLGSTKRTQTFAIALLLLIVGMPNSRAADYFLSGIEAIQLGQKVTKDSVEESLRRIGFAVKVSDWSPSHPGTLAATFKKTGKKDSAIITIKKMNDHSYDITGIHATFFGSDAVRRITFEALKNLNRYNTIGARTDHVHCNSLASLRIEIGNVPGHGVAGVNITISRGLEESIIWIRHIKGQPPRKVKCKFQS